MRLVLGAAPAQVIWLFLRRGAVQLGIGLVIGVAGAFGVGRLLQAQLVQTSPRDPLTLVSIVVLLSIAGARVSSPRDARRAWIRAGAAARVATGEVGGTRIPRTHDARSHLGSPCHRVK